MASKPPQKPISARRQPADLADASFLAGLPQSPSVYDIYTNPEITLARQQQVLVLMYGLSQQRLHPGQQQRCSHLCG